MAHKIIIDFEHGKRYAFKMTFRSKNPQETQKVAANLARKIIKRKVAAHAVAIALEGELGAGKTTFAKGFARALGIKEKITSPTFVLLKRYPLSNKGLGTRARNKNKFLKKSSPKLSSFGFKHLIHIDAYRLRDHRDLIPLGIKEILANPENIVLIEWADRVRKILPRKYLKVHIDHVNKNTRKISIA